MFQNSTFEICLESHELYSIFAASRQRFIQGTKSLKELIYPSGNNIFKTFNFVVTCMRDSIDKNLAYFRQNDIPVEDWLPKCDNSLM